MGISRGPSIGFPLEAAAGDALEAYADTESSTASGTPVKKKEIRIARAGAYRIKYDMKIDVSGGGNTVVANIYKNGVACGTQHGRDTDTYSTYTEDISGFAIGDLIQLYVWRLVASTGSSRNFRIYCVNPIETDVTLDT